MQICDEILRRYEIGHDIERRTDGSSTAGMKSAAIAR